ncbi:MAG TPA: AMP-binding protein, partial [Kofleriaceae bacterium]
MGAFDAATLCEAFQTTVAERGDALALRTKGDATRLSWREVAARVERYAGGLAGLGVTPNEAVAILLINRPEMNLIDLAAVHIGAVPFSMYVTSTVDQIRHLLADSGARVIVTEKLLLPKALAAATGQTIVCVDGAAEGAIDLEELATRVPAGFDFTATWRAVTTDHLLTIIYTSGTTGAPKGVEITHANMMAELRASAAFRTPSPDGHTISYLPHAHIADRMG